jgi:hypothetical protein
MCSDFIIAVSSLSNTARARYAGEESDTASTQVEAPSQGAAAAPWPPWSMGSPCPLTVRPSGRINRPHHFSSFNLEVEENQGN